MKELCPDLEKDGILLIEHPVLKSNPLPPALLNEASINLLVVRANRTWKNTDQALYEHLLQVKQKEVPLLFYLTQADRNTVEILQDNYLLTRTLRIWNTGCFNSD